MMGINFLEYWVARQKDLRALQAAELKFLRTEPELEVWIEFRKNIILAALEVKEFPIADRHFKTDIHPMYRIYVVHIFYVRLSYICL